MAAMSFFFLYTENHHCHLVISCQEVNIHDTVDGRNPKQPPGM